MALKIIKSSINGATGHISVDIQVVEEMSPGRTSAGPIETVGIDHASLFRNFHAAAPPTEETINDALEKWIATHYPASLARKRSIEVAGASVAKLKGHVFAFEEPAGG